MGGESTVVVFFVKGITECVKLTFVQYMESVLPLNAVDDASGCVCMRWARTNERENENKVGRSAKDNDCALEAEWLRATPF